MKTNRKSKSKSKISADDLRAMTGLTDRRHRQLASDGYFPPPERGFYELMPTVTGLLRWHREWRTQHNESRLGKLREEHRRLKMLNDERAGQLVPVDNLCACIGRILSRVDEIIEQKLVNEYPSAVAGMDVPQAVIYGKRLGDSLRVEFQKLGDEWK